MSIFSKFKKIFSSGSDDSFGEDKTQSQVAEERSSMNEYKASQRDIDLFVYTDWHEVINEVFAQKEIIDMINKLRIEYSSINYNDLKIFLDNLSSVADSIINYMRQIYNESLNKDLSKKKKLENFDYVVSKTPTFKSQVVEALLKVISNTSKSNNINNLDAELFNREFNFEINNLKTLCSFIERFLIEYRLNPKIARNFMVPVLHSQSRVDKFIEDCYNIDIFTQNFKQTPYNEISSKDKAKFLDLANSFIDFYGKTNILDKLNILIKLEKRYQSLHPKFNPGIIGGNF